MKAKAEPCLIEGCGRVGVPRKGGLCHGHYYRKHAGLSLDVQLRPWGKPLETLRRAAEAYNVVDSDTNSDVQFYRAADRLKHAGYRIGTKRRTG